ncbi:Aquaporin-9, partial [Blomia tropicalis]
MKRAAKEFTFELVGTCIHILFGMSGCVVKTLSPEHNLLSAGICFSMGAIIAMLIGMKESGAFINPALTVAMCTIGKCQWRKVPHYFVAQYLGAFIGCSIAYAIYHSSLVLYENEMNLALNITGPNEKIAKIFITSPTSSNVTLIPAILDQIVGMCVLMFGILTVTDQSCYETYDLVQILTIGLMIFAVPILFNGGAILNPARDLSPRLFLSLVGYDKFVFQYLDGHYWWAVGIVGPHVGAILGSILFYWANGLRIDVIK